MSTSRKQQSINETDQPRKLVATRADDQRRLALRQRFAKRTATAEGIDVDALRMVHERGWSSGLRVRSPGGE